MKNVGLDLLRYNVGKLMKFIDYRFVAADKRLATELEKKQDKLTAAMKYAIYNAVASAVVSLRTSRSCSNTALATGYLYGSAASAGCLTLTSNSVDGSKLTSSPISLKKGDSVTVWCNYDYYQHCGLYKCSSYSAYTTASPLHTYAAVGESYTYTATEDCVVFMYISAESHKYTEDQYTLVDNNRLIFRDILPGTKLSAKLTSSEIGLIETFIENRFGADVTIGNNTMNGVVNEIYDDI